MLYMMEQCGSKTPHPDVWIQYELYEVAEHAIERAMKAEVTIALHAERERASKAEERLEIMRDIWLNFPLFEELFVKAKIPADWDWLLNALKEATNA